MQQDESQQGSQKVTKEQTSATSSSPLKGRLRGSFPSISHQGAEKIPMCFFCDAPVEQDYHKAATKKLDINVRKMATELKDTLLLAKLSSGDMIATDAVYHKHCLTGFSQGIDPACGKKNQVLEILN